jgi:hypothetical protein
MKFQPGQSGNPAGRPPGSRNKTTIAAEEKLDERAEAVVDRIILRAEGGDPTAMRLCLERLAPTGTNRPLQLELPPIKRADDVTAAADMVMQACVEGTISPRETVCMLTVVERRARIAERALKMKELERNQAGATRRTWELDPSMLPHPVPDPLEPIFAAIKRGEDPFPDHPGWEEGRPKGEALHSPVDSSAGAEQARTPDTTGLAHADTEAAGGAALYSPVNSGDGADGPAEAGLYSSVNHGAEVNGADGGDLYSPVNSDLRSEEPPPGAADAAPPSPAPRGRDEEPAVDDEVATLT